MGRIVERKVTDTADYTLEITQADGAFGTLSGVGDLRNARAHAIQAIKEGAVMVEIYACDYFNSPPDLVQTMFKRVGTKLKCDNCREFKHDTQDYYIGDRSNFYCLACATELGEV